MLATQENFGRAAEILGIAQPALSRQIRLLEEELGIILFKRHARGAKPTGDALVLLERAMSLLRYAEQIRLDLSGREAQPRGPVAFGLPPGLAPLLVSPLLLRLHQDFPDIRLKITESFAPALLDQLVHGAIDLAIVSGSPSTPDTEMLPLFSDAICVIVPFDEARIAGGATRSRALDNMPLILTGIPKSGIRLELETAAARANVTLRAVIEVDSIAVAQALVEDGFGWTVHFAAAIQNKIDARRLRAGPINGLRLHRSLAWAVGHPQSRAAKALSLVLRDLVQNIVRSGYWPNAELTAAGTIEP